MRRYDMTYNDLYAEYLKINSNPDSVSAVYEHLSSWHDHSFTLDPDRKDDAMHVSQQTILVIAGDVRTHRIAPRAAMGYAQPSIAYIARAQDRADNRS